MPFKRYYVTVPLSEIPNSHTPFPISAREKVEYEWVSCYAYEIHFNKPQMRGMQGHPQDVRLSTPQPYMVNYYIPPLQWLLQKGNSKKLSQHQHPFRLSDSPRNRRHRTLDASSNELLLYPFRPVARSVLSLSVKLVSKTSVFISLSANKKQATLEHPVAVRID